MNVLQILAQENYITCSKVVAKKLGVNAAILLGALCSYQNSFDDEEFYKKQSDIINEICLSEYEIRQATKALRETGVLIVTKKGCPAQNYYLVVEDKLCSLLSTSGSKIRPLDLEWLDDNNKNTITKNTNTNKTIREKEKEKQYKKKSGGSVVSELVDESVVPTVKEFVEMRKMLKKPMTEQALKRLLNKLVGLSTEPQRQIEILQQSIDHCWLDVYDLTSNRKEPSAPPSEPIVNEYGTWI